MSSSACWQFYRKQPHHKNPSELYWTCMLCVEEDRRPAQPQRSSSTSTSNLWYHLDKHHSRHPTYSAVRKLTPKRKSAVVDDDDDLSEYSTRHASGSARATTQNPSAADDDYGLTYAGSSSGASGKRSAEDSGTGHRQKRRKQPQFPKDVNAPKPPPSAYSRYIHSVTPTMGNDSQANKVAAASVMWGQLSEEQKQPFLEAAEADRQAYRKELEAYSQTAAFAEYQKKKSEWMKIHLPQKAAEEGEDGEFGMDEAAAAIALAENTGRELCRVCHKTFLNARLLRKHYSTSRHIARLAAMEETGEPIPDLEQPIASLPPINPYHQHHHNQQQQQQQLLLQQQQQQGLTYASPAAYSVPTYTTTTTTTTTNTTTTTASSTAPSLASAPPTQPTVISTRFGDGSNVPIFSEAFLAYNKQRDAELRQAQTTYALAHNDVRVLQTHINGLAESLVAAETELTQEEATLARTRAAHTQLARTLNNALGLGGDDVLEVDVNEVLKHVKALGGGGDAEGGGGADAVGVGRAQAFARAVGAIDWSLFLPEQVQSDSADVTAPQPISLET